MGSFSGGVMLRLGGWGIGGLVGRLLLSPGPAKLSLTSCGSYEQKFTNRRLPFRGRVWFK
jgi:hypothetical protein